MQPVRADLKRIMANLLRSRPAEEAAMFAWPVVCGKEVAERARAVSFAEGTLTVEVADATWRAQLGSFVPTYLRGFEELIGPAVKSIRFKSSR
jgi:Dna[CI] antecedent, DciA